PYLSEAERELARSRVPLHVERTPFNWSFVKRVFGSWYFYGFSVLWIIAGETESFSSNSLLALYMKAHPGKYTVSQLNDYPTGVPAVGIVSTIFWATLTDFLGGKRYLVGYWIGITGIITSAMILAPSATTASTFAAYYWAGSVYACQATFFAWANDALRYEEDSLRAVVIASMNMFSGAVNAWWSIVFYSANYAPKFTRGMWAMIGCSIALVIWTAGVTWMCVRTEKKRISQGVEAYNGDAGDEAISVDGNGTEKA
ncbi:MFS general substrate transporter, partial [Aureobasidium melanogenum]